MLRGIPQLYKWYKEMYDKANEDEWQINWFSLLMKAFFVNRPKIQEEDVVNFLTTFKQKQIDPFASIDLPPDLYQYCAENYCLAFNVSSIVYLSEKMFGPKMSEAIRFAKILGMQIWSIKKNSDYLVAGPYANVPVVAEIPEFITAPEPELKHIVKSDLNQEDYTYAPSSNLIR